jgi:hypothetical protein
MYFDLITWPGNLCYTGDMGTYVFSRVEDMFTFFRQPKERSIDRRYWAEKCYAHDRDGIMEYSPEKAKERLLEWFDEEDEGDVPEGIKEAVDEELMPHIDDERDLREAVYNFRFNEEDYFPDFWEIDLSIFTFRFNWCCHALLWGIAKYDESELPEVEGE